MMATIRPAKQKDIPEILMLGKDFHEYAGLDRFGLGYDPEQFAKMLSVFINNPDGAFFVAEVDGEIVGGIAGSIVQWFLDSSQLNAAEHWWFVHPDHRGTVGPVLLEALEYWAILRGAKVICFAGFYDKRMKALERLYGRRGYKPLEVHFVKEL